MKSVTIHTLDAPTFGYMTMIGEEEDESEATEPGNTVTAAHQGRSGDTAMAESDPKDNAGAGNSASMMMEEDEKAQVFVKRKVIRIKKTSDPFGNFSQRAARAQNIAR